MKQLFTLLLICTMGSTYLFAQQGFVKAIFPEKQFESVLGNPEEVEVYVTFFGHEILSDASTLTGFTYEYKKNSNQKQVLVLHKSLANGDSIWTKSYDLGANRVSFSVNHSIAKTADGGAILSLDRSINHQSFETFLRIDGNGNTLWVKQAEKSKSLLGDKLDTYEKANGNLITIHEQGYNFNTTGFIITELTSQGDFVDRKYYTFPRNQGFLHLSSTYMGKDESLYLAGSFNSSTFSSHQVNVFLGKISPTGQVQLSKVYNGGREFAGVDVLQQNDDIYVGVSGYFSVVLLKTDSLGVPILTNIYEDKSFQNGGHEQFQIAPNKPGISLVIPTQDRQDVMLDLSEGLAGSYAHLKLETNGTILTSEILKGGGDYRGRFDIADNGGGSLDLAYSTYFIDGTEYEHGYSLPLEGINITKINPAPDSATLCKSTPIDPTISTGSFQTSTLTISAPLPVTSLNLGQVLPNGGITSTTGFIFTDDVIQELFLCQATNQGQSSSQEIDEQPITGIIEAFPNPTRGELTLRMKGGLGKMTMRIQDLSGRILMQAEMDEEEDARMDMNMSDMKAGIYILTMEGRDVMIRKKIVKVD